VTVFLTGGSGFVGRNLVAAMSARGDIVLSLSRSNRPATDPAVIPVTGDPTVPGPWLDRLADCDTVVHLAGENLFRKRWTAKFKDEIRRSRVESTRLIAERLASGPGPKVFVSCSAVGYYGPGDTPVDETAPAGTDFMADVCVAWERAADPARAAGVRVVHPRFGIVLDKHEGALPNLAMPFRMFMGGPVGRGRHGVSWVHIDDVVSALLFLLDRPIDGPVNVTAPHPLNNRDFAAALGQALGRPSWLPVPPVAIRVLLGEVADVAASGQWVVPKVLTEKGFSFRYPQLPGALAAIYSG
jgi:uncharacterized protein (TIGR01777 family)